jgi:hypothetical protein
MGLGYHESSTLGLGQQDYRTLPVFIGGGSAIVTSTANIVVQEAEVLEVDEDEVLETDEILDQSDAGPQLIQVSKSAGGCLLR